MTTATQSLRWAAALIIHACIYCAVELQRPPWKNWYLDEASYCGPVRPVRTGVRCFYGNGLLNLAPKHRPTIISLLNHLRSPSIWQIIKQDNATSFNRSMINAQNYNL